MGSAFRGRSDCQRVEERLSEYKADRLRDEEERTRIETHLAHCAACREQVAGWERMEEAIVAFRDAPLPERTGDWQAVRSRLGAYAPQSGRDSRPRRQLFGRPVWTPRAATTGVLAAALGIAAVAYPTNRPAEMSETIEVATPVANNVERATPSTASAPAPFVSLPNGADYIPEKDPHARALELMGFTTVGRGENMLSAATAFTLTKGEVIPLCVEVRSDREVVNAELEVRPHGYLQAERVYRYRVHLRNGVTRVTVYPAFGPRNEDRRTPYSDCDITLTAPGRRQSLQLSVAANSGGSGYAYIGHRFGSITPRRDMQDPEVSRRMSLYPAYTLPEYAPDRAIGYDGLRLLVLAPEAASLNPAQWRAIREWVVMGGQLLLTDSRLLDIPALADMAPIHPRGPLASSKNDAMMKRALVSDEQILVPDGLQFKNEMLFARRYGFGSVACTSFDPSAESFRTWSGSYTFWVQLMRAPVAEEASAARRSAHADNIRYTRQVTYGQPDTSRQGNPFEMALPSIQYVVLIFLGYFVLVVPMTFLVLKHTRRLNLAWLTAPVLALAFAGGIFLLTARLYFMPTARRTAGTVFLQSGEKAGRFCGYTEMFFPRAGRYDVPFADADLVEMNMLLGERSRPLTTVTDEQDGTTSAQPSVGNLAFRRIHHEQSVTLSGSVNIAAQLVSNGDLVGFVQNNTGQKMVNVSLNTEVTVPDPNRDDLVQNKKLVYRLSDLPAGETTFRIPRGQWLLAEPANPGMRYAVSWAHRSLQPGMQNRLLTFSVLHQLRLTAEVPGETFGPRTGQDFSGDRSVTLMVGLNLKTGGEQ